MTTDLAAVALSPVPWSGGVGTRTSSLDPAAAVALLPLSAEHDPYERLAAAFLAGYTENSARAYRNDLVAWWRFCAAAGVHPFDARRHHVDAWVRTMQAPSSSGTEAKKPMKPASIRRRLSAVSKLYKYAIDSEVLHHSPVEHVRRPPAPTGTDSVGFARDELDRMLDAAAAHSPRSFALVTLLTYNGLRIDEATGADVSDYRHQEGHRVLRIVRKGGATAVVPLAPPTIRAIDDYLASRTTTDGALFVNHDETARLPYTTAYDLVRRLARRAEVPSADDITPHSFRHTFITQARAAGVPLEDVQDAAGHKDPKTTRGYDRSRVRLDQHPTYRLASFLSR